MYDGQAKLSDFNLGIKFHLPHPTLILGAGIGGAGKSTFFRPLARAISDSVYLDKDLINYSFLWKPREGKREDMTRYVPQELIPLVFSVQNTTNNNYYRDHVFFQSYHYMLMMARQMLSLGKHPILDGNYVKEIRWGYIEQVLIPQLEDVNYKLKIVLVHAPENEIRKRLIVRGNEADKLKAHCDEEWNRVVAEQPPVPKEIEKYPHIKVDTSEPISKKTFLEVLEFLSD